MARTIVSMLNVDKWYGENHIVKNMNLDIREGEFLTLLGPSGCGKTTMLRMVSGFEQPSAGTIKVEDESVEKKEPYQRNVNTVFQNYALFPNMNVFNNVAYGLRIKKVPKAEIRERVKEMLKLVQLEGFEKRRISQMSGGQKQRIALARALINHPKVLLLDEPLGALDLKLRKQMQIELKQLQKRLGITFIYVTHDQEEALTMSDRIAIINEGVMEQIDTPKNIYEHPKTRFVAEFIGESNIFDVVVKSVLEDRAELDTGEGHIAVPGSEYTMGEKITVSVRPEVMLFSKEPVSDFSINGMVKDVIYVGNFVKMVVEMKSGQQIKITRFDSMELANLGDVVYLSWPLEKGVVIRGV